MGDTIDTFIESSHETYRHYDAEYRRDERYGGPIANTYNNSKTQVQVIEP